MDVSAKEIEAAFANINSVAADLKRNGAATIPDLGWNFHVRSAAPVTFTEQEHNAYRAAERNRCYPFKSARQFTRYKPFLLIFAYNGQFAPNLTLNFAGTSEVTFRALARRAFMQLAHDIQPVAIFDKRVGVETVQDASALLSGLMFLNLESDDAYIYLNPRATHPLSDEDIGQLTDFDQFLNILVDDFAFDNY